MMKRIMLLLALLTALLFTATACAEVMPLGDTRLTLDIGDMTVYDLTEEDIEEEMVLAFGDGENIDCVIYVYRSHIRSAKEFVDYLADTEGLVTCGLTTINGVEAYYEVVEQEGEHYVAYYALDSGLTVQIDFWYADDEAAMMTRPIMESMKRGR